MRLAGQLKCLVCVLLRPRTQFYLVSCQDRVIAIPEEFLEATVLGAQSSSFQFLCSVEGNDMR